MFSNRTGKVTIVGRSYGWIRPTGHRGTNRTNRGLADVIHLDRKRRRHFEKRLVTAEIVDQLDDARDVINPVVTKPAPASRPIAYAGFGPRGVLRLQRAA